ncbi:hypothetical protein ACRALDRAFT_207790 [Sodiomyces alcalophilus JCM 7366]|uniref:uncharacterized protein n=1 Tax=Sodiomyces alcalophilus JCM 7366 TaxID=591952 RepID=UPI0039B3680E
MWSICLAELAQGRLVDDMETSVRKMTGRHADRWRPRSMRLCRFEYSHPELLTTFVAFHPVLADPGSLPCHVREHIMRTLKPPNERSKRRLTDSHASRVRDVLDLRPPAQPGFSCSTYGSPMTHLLRNLYFNVDRLRILAACTLPTFLETAVNVFVPSYLVAVDIALGSPASIFPDTDCTITSALTSLLLTRHHNQKQHPSLPAAQILVLTYRVPYLTFFCSPDRLRFLPFPSPCFSLFSTSSLDPPMNSSLHAFCA